MTSVAAWVVYCGVVAAVLTAGAFAWEYSARWSGRPARWGWATALAGSAALPWLLRLVPERAWPEVVTGPMHMLPAAPLTILEPIGLPAEAVTAPAATLNALDFGVFAWAALSVLMLIYVVGAVLSVAAARRNWRASQLDGARVYLSDDTGPAALGLRRGLIVVPSWALQLGDDGRALLLAHEREHVRAGDPRLLFFGLLCVAAMPWNPLLWLQLLRLRNAIELDCDARVLARGVDPRAYGALLLEVGQRRSGHALVMATLSEPRVFLEERIRRIARYPLQRSRSRAVAFGAIALLFFVTAFSARDPLRAGSPSMAGTTLLPLGGSAEAVEPVRYDQQGNPFFELEPIVAVDPDGEALDVMSARVPVMVSDTPPAGERIDRAPTFTPMTVRPQLRNQDEVTRLLDAAYPRALREAGIGGTVLVWFFIDADGNVQRTQLSRTSGYPALDEAGMAVAQSLKFSPAMNRDQRVAVWVEIPVHFSARATDRAIGSDPAAPAPRITRERTAVTPADRAAPTMRIRPELLNAADVQRSLVRNYPPLLRDAGVGGTVMAWFYVGTDGRVLRTQVGRSSGYPALDQAAINIAQVAQFSPQREDGRAVEAWVELPIAFGNAAVPTREARDGLVLLEALRVEGVRGAVAPPSAGAPPTPPPAPEISRRVSPEMMQMVEQGPVFTPMTTRPELRNQLEVQQALVRSYPPLLRDAGIGGTAVLWFLIDEEGRVVTTRLSRTSGYPALDEAALNVARAMQFSPALNRDRRVTVWLEIPVHFSAR